MKRRSFLKGLLGAIGFGGTAVAAEMQYVSAGFGKLPKLEETVEVEYGAVYSTENCYEQEMPAEFRAKCDDGAANVSAMTGFPVTRREYIWLPSGMKDKTDPFGTTAYAGVKFWLAVPKKRYEADTSAQILAGGWSQDQPPYRPGPVECADFRIDGRTVRHWRVVV